MTGAASTYSMVSKVNARGITPSLESARRVSGNPLHLDENSGLSFQGCILATMGFVLDAAEAQRLLFADPRNATVVRPYLNGADLNDHSQQQTERWVINFADWPFERAARYIEPFELLEARVKSEIHGKHEYPGWDERWWQFWRPRAELHEAIAGRDRTLAITRVSKTVMPAFISTDKVMSEQTVAFIYDDNGHFGVLTSTFHWWWAHAWCSTMRSAGLRYSPTDAFETFPQPIPQAGPSWVRIEGTGRRLNEFRADLMVRTRLGLTKTYNRVHNPEDHDPDIRAATGNAHRSRSRAVSDAYDWSDLGLNHHHWKTPQGMRFTVSPEAKDELLDRLLELNHERYAAEVAAGLHDKKAKKALAKSKTLAADPNQDTLL